MTWQAVAAIVVLGTAARATAQTSPPRPPLDEGADTNSAAAYYASGMYWVSHNPRRAADAFHWAALLDPNAGAALYGRRVALLLSQPLRLVGYFERTPAVMRSPEVLEIDSLLQHALYLDPFFYRGLDELLVTSYVTEALRSRGAPVLTGGSGDLRYEIEQYLRNDAPPYLRALVAYANRRFPRALELLGLALRRAKLKAGLHAERGVIFHHLGLYDSAAAEIQAALGELRRRDETELVEVYESKALLELSLGVMQEARGDLAGAYEAYSRAATEDLSFHPAHIRLATLALHRGDTATAVAEVGLAIDARPDDVALLVAGSVLLVSAGYAPEALPHLLRARDLNPYYATPHYLLGRLHDVAGMTLPAVEHYQAFLAHASWADSRTALVRQRLVTLEVPPADSGAVRLPSQ